MALTYTTRGSTIGVEEADGEFSSWIFAPAGFPPKIYPNGVFAGEYASLAQATVALEGFLTVTVPLPDESAAGTRTTAGVGSIVDATHVTFAIEAVTNRVMRNQLTFTGLNASKLVYGSNHTVYACSLSDGVWNSWNGATWTPGTLADPYGWTTAADWTKIDAPGETVYDDRGVEYSFGNAVSSGWQILQNGVNLQGAWGDIVKIGNSTSSRHAWHHNPAVGWIEMLGTGLWSSSPQSNDPEGGVIIITPPSAVVTTGSIAAGQTTLNVADASIFPQALINAGKCHVIVEIGGEAGGGHRGTKGCGGQWPFNSSETQAQIQASAGYEQLCKGAVDTGRCWRYTAQQGGWIPTAQFANTRYYDSWIVPIALNARVVSKNGNTLTLDRPAQQTTSNAACHVDYWQTAMDAIASTPNGGTINWNTVFPGLSSIPLGDALWMANRSDLTFTCNSEGSLEFYAPSGSAGIGFYWSNCTNCVWKFAGIRGNWSVNKEKYGFGWATAHPNGAHMNAPLSDDENDRGGRLMRSFNLSVCGGCIIQDCTIAYLNGGIVFISSGSCHTRRVKVPSVAFADYFQWQIDFYFCDNCTQEDCVITSPTGAVQGFELYCCVSCKIIRPQGLNAYSALNTCQGCRYGSDPNNLAAGGGELRFTRNQLNLLDWDTPYVAQTQAYTLEAGPQSGNIAQFPPTTGVIDRVRFIFEDVSNTTTNDMAGGIHIDRTQTGYTVTNCFYQGPDYRSPSTWAGPQLLWSDARAGETFAGGTTYGGNIVIGIPEGSNPQKYSIYSLGGFSLGGNVAASAYPSLP